MLKDNQQKVIIQMEMPKPQLSLTVETVKTEVKPLEQILSRPSNWIAMRQLVDQEHAMMLMQEYCGYTKAKVKNANRQDEITDLIRSLSRKKSRKLRQKLWDVHEYLKPSNLTSLKEKMKSAQLKGDMLFAKNAAFKPKLETG